MEVDEQNCHPQRLRATVLEDPTHGDFLNACHDCCNYAKKNLQCFVAPDSKDRAKYEQEVLQLMGAIAHIQIMAASNNARRGSDAGDRYPSSPCEHMLKHSQQSLSSLRTDFIHSFCLVHNLSLESPLLKTVEASVYAIPKLAKVRKIIARDNGESRANKELPIDVELGEAMKFHNVFVCPVSKEPSAALNMPQLLACGHVISK